VKVEFVGNDFDTVVFEFRKGAAEVLDDDAFAITNDIAKNESCEGGKPVKPAEWKKTY